MSSRTIVAKGDDWHLIGLIEGFPPVVNNVRITTVSKTSFLEDLTLSISLDMITWQPAIDLAGVGESVNLGTIDTEVLSFGYFKISGTSSNYGNGSFALTLSGDGIDSSTITGNVLVTDTVDPAITAPGPVELAAHGHATSALLEWTTPEDDGGSDILGYRIYRGTSPSNLTMIINGPSNSSTYSNTGLTNGNTYFYAVAAYNVRGTATLSNIVAVLIGNVPNTPTITATGVQGRVKLSWLEPNDNGFDITSYRIHRTPGFDDVGISETKDYPSGITSVVPGVRATIATNLGVVGVSDLLVDNPTGLENALGPTSGTGWHLTDLGDYNTGSVQLDFGNAPILSSDATIEFRIKLMSTGTAVTGESFIVLLSPIGDVWLFDGYTDAGGVITGEIASGGVESFIAYIQSLDGSDFNMIMTVSSATYRPKIDYVEMAYSNLSTSVYVEEVTSLEPETLAIIAGSLGVPEAGDLFADNPAGIDNVLGVSNGAGWHIDDLGPHFVTSAGLNFGSAPDFADGTVVEFRLKFLATGTPITGEPLIVISSPLGTAWAFDGVTDEDKTITGSIVYSTMEDFVSYVQGLHNTNQDLKMFLTIASEYEPTIDSVEMVYSSSNYIETDIVGAVSTLKATAITSMPEATEPPTMSWPEPPAGGLTYTSLDFQIDDLHSVTQDIIIYNDASSTSAQFLNLWDCYIDGVYMYMGLQTLGSNDRNILWTKFGNDPNDADVQANGDTVALGEGSPFVEGESCALYRAYGGNPLPAGLYRTRIIREEAEGDGDWFALYLTYRDLEEDLIGRIRFTRTDPEVPCSMGPGGTWTEAWNNNDPMTMYKVPYWHVAVKTFGNDRLPVNYARAAYSLMPHSDIWAEEPGGFIHHEIGEHGVTSGGLVEDEIGDFVQRYHDFPNLEDAWGDLWSNLNGATPVYSAGSIANKIEWTAPITPCIGFRILRGTNTVTPTMEEIAIVDFETGDNETQQATLSYVDGSWGPNPIVEGTDYIYQIQLIPEAGLGAYSSEVPVGSQITEVTLEGTQVTYWDVPTEVNVGYSYRVTAVNAMGESEKSNAVAIEWSEPDAPVITDITETP